MAARIVTSSYFYTYENKIKMKINNKEIALLHCPRCGGTTIEQSPDITTLGHMGIYNDINPKCERINYIYTPYDQKSAQQAVLPLSHIQKYYNLFIVRNHYSWLLSFWDWTSGLSRWNSNHHEYAISRRGFDFFVKNIIDREDGWPSRKNIFCQMFSTDGLLIPDHILHTEELDGEMIGLFQKHGGKWVPPPRMQIGRRHGNFGGRSAGRGKNLDPS